MMQISNLGILIFLRMGWPTPFRLRGQSPTLSRALLITREDAFCFLLFCFLGPYLQHMEVPRLGVESELQLSAYTTATATQDPSQVCSLHHGSRQRWIPDPLNKTRDQTHIVPESRVGFLTH